MQTYVSSGKYRKFPKCVDDVGNANSWQIADMPIKASECDQWYKDCYDDFFCTCLEVRVIVACNSLHQNSLLPPQGECPKDVSPRSFFSLTKVDCNKDTCRTFGSLFSNGSDLCETLWDGAFVYEPVEEDAYSMSWNPARTGGVNPNALINTYVPFPDTCPGAKIDLVRE